MFFSKYKNLVNKFFGNVLRHRVGWKKKLTKFIKFCYLLIELPIEIIGDIVFFWKRFNKKNIENPKKILIIRIDQFGDVLFSTFLFPLIKKKYPEASIDIVINPKTNPIIKENPYINKIYLWKDPFLKFVAGRSGDNIKIDGKNINWLRFSELKKEKYDVVINGRPYPPSSNIFWKLIKPKFLISFDISEQSFISDRWALYDLYEEEWKNYLNLLKPIGINIDDSKFEPGFYNFNEASLLEKHKSLFSPFDKLVVLSPVSFDKERQWPIDSWKKIINFLLGNGCKVVLTGIGNQKDYLTEIAEDLDSSSVKVITDLNIPELAALYKRSSLFIGIDSFPAHLAIALKKPAVVFVNTDIYYLKGFSEMGIVDARCMIPIVSNVSIKKLDAGVEDVIASIKYNLD